MKIVLKTFHDLTNQELYSILQLRSEVFVVEQDCVYQDVDGHDQAAWHVLGFAGDDLAAYARILKPGVQHKEAAIGRVVTSLHFRGKELGKQIFAASKLEAQRLFPNQALRIMAQCYLIKFYEEFGFVADGEEFLEDGIPHVEMASQPMS
jgi:ElaA protein